MAHKYVQKSHLILHVLSEKLNVNKNLTDL